MRQSRINPKANMTYKNVNKRPIRIGVSSCLLGEKVRHDGEHKKDRYITDVLGSHFEWIAVCPELEVGMGVPREAVRLIGTAKTPRMIGRKTGTDWTGRMKKFSTDRVRQLERLNLSGYIFKKDSPSCGMERVRVYSNAGGTPARNGRGLFAGVIMKQFPLIPVEEEGRLNDAKIKENFIVRVFSYHRLQNLMTNRFDRGDLVRFHTVHKYLILAHSPKHYKQLGRLVADASKFRPSELREPYSSLFMEALNVKTSTRKNVNVLQHILGFLREYLTAAEKRDILEVIEDYHRELIPLIVPVTLIRHYVRKHDVEYIRDQLYLNPHPKELMLRNHV